MEEAVAKQKIDIESAVKDILSTIEREREREIVARRFGLFDRRETLGQIGELLGITRERVRQLEKAVVTKLNEAAANGLPHIKGC
jgi:DNA-directed RNA polymerase sigma subunit (sigma70/sigma32)